MQFRHELLGEYRAQFVDATNRLWVTKGYDVYYSDDLGTSFSYRAKMAPPWLMSISTRSVLATRFLRGGFLSMRPLQDGALLGSLYGGLVRCEAASDQFSWVLNRPGRTMKVEVLPGGEILAGEYFTNRARMPVDILASLDGGSTWEVVHRFRSGDIRHIHTLSFDKRFNSLLVLTGDTDRESKILCTGDRFGTLRALSEGTQRSRAVAILPTEGGYYVATDTQYEQNYIQFLSLDGTLRVLCPIVGSCLGGCQVDAWSFFATACEPSPANLDPSVTLYGTCNAREWHVVHRWRVDRWSWPTAIQAAAFQMGRVLLPRGENCSKHLFGTPLAVREHDGILHRWKLP